MKKTVPMLALFILITSINLFSQQVLVPYKAKEGIQTAQNSANNSGIPNMELFIIVTMTGSMPGYEVSIEFDINTGKSNVWVYVFRSTVYPDSIKGYVVVRLPLIGFMTVTEVPGGEILSMLPIVPDSSLVGRVWIDSDIMSQKIRENETFNEIKNQVKDLGNAMVGLGINNTTLFEPNTPYWLVSFIPEGGILNCYVNAVTGETECFGSVIGIEWQEEQKDKILVFPNPATDHIYIRLPETQSQILYISLYDTQGNLVRSFDPSILGNNLNVLLPTNNLSAGTYFIELSTPENTYKTKFVINK